MKTIKIAIYNDDGKLIGYKADTFWTLVKDKKSAKSHSLVDGKIPEHLISSFIHLLNKEAKSNPKAESGSLAEVLGNICDTISDCSRQQQFFMNENRLAKVGYEFEDSDEVIFTHCVSGKSVTEI